MTPAFIVPLISAGAVLIILLVLIVLLVAWAFGMYNSLVRMRNQVQESWHQVDVELQRRYDLIPNLVETVKGYAGHERNTLEEVVRLRNQAASMAQPGALPSAERAQVEQQLSAAVSKLLVTVEAYPDLKANANFVELQRALTETEDRIAAGRRFYNANVRAYNTKVESVPTNMVANMFKFEKANYFEVNDPEVRSAQRVDFGTMSQSGPTQSQLEAQRSQPAIGSTYQTYPTQTGAPAAQAAPFDANQHNAEALHAQQPQVYGAPAPQQGVYAPQGAVPGQQVGAQAGSLGGRMVEQERSGDYDLDAANKAALLNDPSESGQGQQSLFSGVEPGQAGQPVQPAPQYGGAQYGNLNVGQPLPGEYGSKEAPAAPLTDPYGNPVDQNKPYGR